MALKLDSGPAKAPRTKPVSSYRPKKCFEALHKDLTYDKTLKIPDDPFTAGLKAAGIAFEASIGARLAARRGSAVITCNADTNVTSLRRDVAAAKKVRIAVVESDDSPHGTLCAEAATHELAQRPGAVSVLWNASLRSWRTNADGSTEWGQRSGKPDMLVRTGTARKVSWEGVDVKEHRVLGGTAAKLSQWEVSSVSGPSMVKTIEGNGPFNRDDAMQLAHYYRMLQFHGLAGAPRGGVIGKNPDGKPEDKIIWVDLTDNLYDRGKSSSLDIYDTAFNEVWAVAEHARTRRGMTVTKLTRVEWKSECATCPWREVCHEEAVRANEPTLLPGVTVDIGRSLRLHGIDTVERLAGLHIPTAGLIERGAKDFAAHVLKARQRVRSGRGAREITEVCKADSDASLIKVLTANGVDTVAKLASLDHNTAKLSVGELSGKARLCEFIDQARVTDFAARRSKRHVFLRRGKTALPLPKANVEIHVDMEDDGIIYMWGVRIEKHFARKTEAEYIPFVSFDNTPESEAKVFADFWAFLTKAIAVGEAEHGPDSVKVYHYTAAEDRCLIHLARKHSGARGVKIPSEAKVAEFLASDTWFDMHPLLKSYLVWPTQDHTLKSLAKYAMFMWRDSDPSGASSTVWYKHACNPKLDAAERAAWQERILLYNEDDVRAQSHLLGFFRQMLRAHNVSDKLQSVTAIDKHYPSDSAVAA